MQIGLSRVDGVGRLQWQQVNVSTMASPSGP